MFDRTDYWQHVDRRDLDRLDAYATLRRVPESYLRSYLSGVGDLPWRDGWIDAYIANELPAACSGSGAIVDRWLAG